MHRPTPNQTPNQTPTPNPDPLRVYPKDKSVHRDELDLYKILEVPRTASSKEISMAYRRLAKTWHPDKNQHRLEEAEIRFKEINMANGILSDEQQRTIYDRFGFEAVNNSSPGPNQGPGFGPGFGPGPGIFAQMFGGGFQSGIPGFQFGPGFQGRRPPVDPLAQYHVLVQTIPVPLADLYQGREIEMKVHKRVRKLSESLNDDNKSQTSVVMETVTQKFQVIPGMVYGQKYQLSGQGHYLNEDQFGNLIVVLVPVDPEPSKFKLRDPNSNSQDLIYPVEISFKQALCGFSLPIIHLDGKIMVLESTGLCDLADADARGQLILNLNSRKIVGLGMPCLPIQNQTGHRNRGDLYLEFQIVLDKENCDLSALTKLIPDTALDKKYTVKTDHQVIKFSDLEVAKTEIPVENQSNEMPPGVECRTQ